MKRFLHLVIAACLLSFAAPVVTTTIERALDAPACSISIDCVQAADFGRTTQGASWLTVEVRYSCTTITVTSGQTGIRVRAYLQSAGSATGGLKAALYNTAGTSKLYESAELSGFTDTTGGWKDFTGGTITGAISAATYRLCVIGDAIAGGGNTVNIAYDTVGSDTALYQYAFYGGTWPALDADISGLFGATGAGTHNISLYLETSSGASGSLLLRRRRS